MRYQLREQAVLQLRPRHQVLRHQQRQHPLFRHVAGFYLRCVSSVRKAPAPYPFPLCPPPPPPPHSSLLTPLFPFLSYQYPPSPDSKIVSLSCPSNNSPGCQKTPYILRMTFASSLYFLAMCVLSPPPLLPPPPPPAPAVTLSSGPSQPSVPA